MVRPQREFEFLKVATKKCKTRWIRLVTLASRPVDASSVAVFRVLFGTIFCFSMVRFVGKGWVAKLYLEPANNVTYPFFGWIKPLPEPIMYLHIFALATLGLCIAIGYRQRLSAGLLTLGFLYIELIDATRYLNHYWLVTLIALLLTILPVNNIWTLDAAVGRVPGSTTVPVFVVWILRAQLSCVYVFAGIAKLNEDWLIHAQPMRLWLADRAEIYLAGPLLSTTEIAIAASWAGAIFDCTIVAWLLWKRSRRLAYGTLVFFHLLTAALFPIGVFPLLMIAAMLLFFEPDWPRKVFRLSSPPALDPAQIKEKSTTPLLIFLALFTSVQILLPLRHYAYDTNVRWTERAITVPGGLCCQKKLGISVSRLPTPRLTALG